MEEFLWMKQLLMVEFVSIGIIFMIPFAAPLAPMLSVIENPTSITVNWITISDANGYVVYINDAAYIVIGGDSANYTVDGLIPGTNYSITVRAYQDVLGPSSTIFAAATNRKFDCATMFYSLIAIMSVTATPISLVTKILDFVIEIQCQSDVLSESLVIMVNSTAYNIPQLSLISKFNAIINQTGFDISVQCIWSVNGGIFMDETILNGIKNTFYFYYCICQLAPSIPTVAIVGNPTSIEVYWKPVLDANGYVVYVDNTVYDIIENTTITIDELTPGRRYVIAVRAYQDILGPASKTCATANNGNVIKCCIKTNVCSLLATTLVRTTLVSPITLMTLKTGLMYELQCQTNAIPDSLNITIGSNIYNTNQFIQNSTYISKVIVTQNEFTGADITVHCSWNVNGGTFTNSSIIQGIHMCLMLNYNTLLYSSIINTYCITSQYYYY